ncbi:VCBS repeat-containing protein, partial [Maritalea mobilis]
MANDVNKDQAQNQDINPIELDDTILLAQAEDVVESEEEQPVEENQEPTEEEGGEGTNAGAENANLRVEIPLGENNVAQLPEGADLTQPRVVDGELEFLQPDGTIIFVPNGAVEGMTVFVGDVEFPSEALQALFDANNIQPAAGPSVTGEADTPQPVQDSHGAYQDSSQGSIGDGLGISPLLPPTALAFATPEQEEIYEGPETNVDPIGLDDTNWVQEDGEYSDSARASFQGEATGNVLENINHPGAPAGDFADQADTDENPTDTLTVTNAGTYFGQYGTLVLNDDGSYTYSLNSQDLVIQSLSEGETLTESFPYSISDGNGGTGSATLTITIFGSDDGVFINGLTVEGPDEIVYEANLSDGTAPDNAALTQSGTFSFNALDGTQTITIEGVTIFENGAFVGGTPTVGTSIGTLTITSFTPITSSTGEVVGGTIGYSYTLDANSEDHNNAGNDTIVEAFDVEVTDEDGSSDIATIHIEVVDDVPDAIDDGAQSVAEDAVGTISGNVLSNDELGADGASLTHIDVGSGMVALTSGTDLGGGVYQFVTANGTYTFTSAGAWTFDPNANLDNAAGVDASFDYTLTDGDNDADTATQPIT